MRRLAFLCVLAVSTVSMKGESLDGQPFRAPSRAVASLPAMFISPAGNDRNPGTEAAPFKTFAKAFKTIRGGGELVLLDGTYGRDTGIMNADGPSGSAQIPSGSAASPTFVHAKNPGKVVVTGQLLIGRADRKDSYIRVEGITFDSGSTASAGALFNTSFITIRNGGFHSTVNDGGVVLDIGTNDGTWGNTDNLIEDVWVWGRSRGVVANYRADRNTWRRIVVRGDGCSAADCAGSGNPNIGITVYDSAHVLLENVIVMDRVLDFSRNNYADFAVAQHTPGLAGGDNRWLGTISINAPDHAYYFEPDQQTINPSNTLRNVVAWNPTESGISINRSGQAIVENATLKPRGEGALYFGENVRRVSSAANVLVLSGAVYGATIRGLSRTDPAMKYPLRSSLGATVEQRYVNGQLTAEPLWPWPNEARIKAEMCAGGVTRGFCSDSSLTHYVWNLMGNGVPASFGGSAR